MLFGRFSKKDLINACNSIKDDQENAIEIMVAVDSNIRAAADAVYDANRKQQAKNRQAREAMYDGLY